jgi:hypothetical protein
LLDGLAATSNAGLLGSLSAAAPRARVVADRRFVDEGKVVTAGGLMAGLDASFHVIEKLLGRGTAQRVALSQEYPWNPESKWARALMADRYVPTSFASVAGVQRRLEITEGDATQWRTVWAIWSELTTEKLVDLHASALDTPFSGDPIIWELEAGPAPRAGVAVKRWVFADSAGILWRASVRAVPHPSSEGAKAVSFEVRRTDESAPARLRWKRAAVDARLDVGPARVGAPLPSGLDTARTRIAEGGHFRVTLVPVGGHVPANGAWRLTVTTPGGAPVDGAEIQVGAGMPQHGHAGGGDPKVARRLGRGEYELSGVSIGGMGRGDDAWWEIRLIIRAGVVEDLAVFNVLVPPRTRGRAG